MASGNSMSIFVAAAGEPPGTDYATLTTRNNHLLLAFDASTPQSTVFRGVLPSSYAGGGATIDLYWAGGTATADDVVWGASWEEGNENNNDLDADNFGAESTATGTADATSGQKTKTTLTITHANMGSPAAG